ncbi:MAG: hypothetical protein H6684_08700 [Deltaproteobacteria bacterium]|nr:hypothetical protein [bacterium]MCB9488796.1 hypothetical protein [Deltaproteobacteria bacterium]
MQGRNDWEGTLQGEIEFLRSYTKVLETELQTLRQAECPICGRSLAPSGPCMGCQTDLLKSEVEALSRLAMIPTSSTPRPAPLIPLPGRRLALAPRPPESEYRE